MAIYAEVDDIVLEGVERAPQEAEEEWLGANEGRGQSFARHVGYFA
jgi:hypothetical protein